MESVLRSRGYYGGPLYSHPDTSSLIFWKRIEKNDVTVLRNEWTELDISGQSLILCGVDDIWAGRANPPVIPDNGSYLIYLVHEPFYREEWNADLILVGHTHGGAGQQWRISITRL